MQSPKPIGINNLVNNNSIMLHRSLGLSLLLLCWGLPSLAQTVTTDGTVGTAVATSGTQFTITGGSRELTTLFHSFAEFSPAIFDVLFQLDATQSTVDVVIGRVTGSNASSINGQLSLTGGNNPDVFLINPNGITFGSDASLSLPGSFVASTAESVLFQGGLEFSSTNPTTAPMLTVSTPTGLQMGVSSQGIQVNDAGYTTLRSLPWTPDSSASLQVAAGHGLVLLGSDITLSGGLLAAPGGRVDLGSVSSGTVTLGSDNWALGYDAGASLGDIQLLSQSLLNASDILYTTGLTPYAFGSQGGDIQLRGRQISLQGGSRALIQNSLGTSTYGDIQANASEILQLEGMDTSSQYTSALITGTIGASGVGGNIEASAAQLYLNDGGNLLTESFSAARGGNIQITVSDTMQLLPNTINSTESTGPKAIAYGSGTSGDITVSSGTVQATNSAISSRSAGSGAAGAVNVSANQLFLMEGSTVASVAFSSGNSGDVLVNANNIEITGVNSVLTPSIITASAFNTGNAGDVTVNTQTLNVQAGGRIDSSTVAYGDAGTVRVTATESIVVEGTVPDSVNPSLLISSANVVDATLQAFLATVGVIVPDTPTGAAGDLFVTTPSLRVRDGGQVTVKNDGTGVGGTMQILADQVRLDDGGSISASTQSGGGGNIDLRVAEVVLLRNGSLISVESGGTGDGGNIAINVPFIIGLGNSDIVANAFQGNGGNIDITAQGIYGLEFRDQLTSENDITASSQFGVSGTVDINNFGIAPDAGLVELPTGLVDTSNQVAQGCASGGGNEFIATGRGGIPINPTVSAGSDRTWTDTRNLSPSISSGQALSTAETGQASPALPLSPSSSASAPITEATAWQTNAAGQIEFVTADNTEPTLNAYATCAKS